MAWFLLILLYLTTPLFLLPVQIHSGILQVYNKQLLTSQTWPGLFLCLSAFFLFPSFLSLVNSKSLLKTYLTSYISVILFWSLHFTPRWVKNSFLYACNSLYLFYSRSYLFIEQTLQWCSLCVRHCSKKFRNTNSLNLQENAEIGIAFLSSLYTWGNSGTERFKNTANKWDIKPAFKFGSKPPKHKH